MALLVLTEARREARIGPDGVLVVLTEQDNDRWDTAMLAEGFALLQACERRNRPGTYQLQAAVYTHTPAEKRLLDLRRRSLRWAG